MIANNNAPSIAVDGEIMDYYGSHSQEQQQQEHPYMSL